MYLLYLPVIIINAGLVRMTKYCKGTNKSAAV